MTTDPRQQRIWDTTQEIQQQALSGEHSTLLKTYPNGGKTFGFGSTIAALDEPGTIFQPNRALRQETAEQNEENHGLDNFDYPSFFEDCRFADEDDPAYDPEAVEWRRRGASPKLIGEIKGKPEDDPYYAMMASDWDNFQMHTGDPAHMFLERAVSDRHVAFDDVDAYSAFTEEHSLTSDGTRRAVMEYLDLHSAQLPEAPRDWGRILNPSPQMASAMKAVVNDNPSDLDIPDTTHVTSETGAVVRAIAARDDRAVWREIGDSGSEVRHIAVRVRHEMDDHVVHMRLPVHLGDAKSITMMTATPVYPIFEQVFSDLGVASQVVDSIPTEQKEEYFEEIIGTTVVQTTEALKAVSGGNNLDPETFRVAVEWMIEQHGEKPLVVSSKKAIEAGEEDVDSDNEPIRVDTANGTEYKDGLADVIEEFDLESVNFSRAIGTNEFAETELAVVWGCPHFGDGYVKRAAAVCGDTDAEAVRYEDQDGNPCSQFDAGASRVETYWTTQTAQEIYENMTAGSVLQSIMRVGRSSDSEAVVYAHTSAIPDDIPTYKPQTDGELFHTWTDGEDEVVNAIYDHHGHVGDALTARDVLRHVDVSRTTVYRALSRLVEYGVLEPAGTGDWGAEAYSLAYEEAANTKGGVPEVVSETLDRLLMEKRNDFEYSEPEYDDRVGTLTAPGGTEPVSLEVGQPGEVQVSLSTANGAPSRPSGSGPARRNVTSGRQDSLAGEWVDWDEGDTGPKP